MSNAETLIERFLGKGNDSKGTVVRTRRKSVSSSGLWGRAVRQEAMEVARDGVGKVF